MTTWTEAETKQIMDAWRASDGGTLTAILAALDEALRILAARPGTMTAEEASDLRRLAVQMSLKADERLLLKAADAIAALGAKVAALEARNEDLRLALTERTRSFNAQKKESREQAARADAAEADLARLKPSDQVAEDVESIRVTINCWCLKDNPCEQHKALSRLAARAQQGQAIRRIRDVIGAYDSEDTPDARAALARVRAAVDGAPAACVAGLCGHKDADKPGHAAEVVERSQAFNEVAAEGMRVCQSDDDGKATFYNEGYDKGAEAMRASIRAEVDAVLTMLGLIDRYVQGQIFMAIEGAAP